MSLNVRTDLVIWTSLDWPSWGVRSWEVVWRTATANVTSGERGRRGSSLKLECSEHRSMVGGVEWRSRGLQAVGHRVVLLGRGHKVRGDYCHFQRSGAVVEDEVNPLSTRL